MTEPGDITLRPIGVVRSDVPDTEVPRQRRDMVSTIEILPRYAPALLGIEAYSHLIVAFWMHRAPPADTLVYHPRGDPRLPLTGVLASRGRNHPNPLGLAVVELLARSGPALTVRRLDAFDGTPVIDIKPYDLYDSVSEPTVPEWLRQRARAPR